VAKRQREFNIDMDAYLDRRKGGSQKTSFSLFNSDSFSKKKVPSYVPDVHDQQTTIVERNEPRRSWFAFLFGTRSSSEEEDLPEDVREEVEELEDTIEEIDHEVEELEERKAGLFTRFFMLLRMRKPQEPEDDGDMDPSVVAHAMGDHARNEALLVDTRAVLKDLHKWLGKLPPEQIDSFKRSPDFKRYKDLLEAYGLIK
jgi:hypothetical protein